MHRRAVRLGGGAAAAWILLTAPVVAQAGDGTARLELSLEVGRPEPLAVKIELERVSTTEAGSAPPVSREIDALAPGAATVDVAEGEVWQARLTADGYWAPEELLTPGRSVRVELRRSATLRAVVGVPRGDEPPASMSVRLSSGRQAAELLPPFDCPIVEQRIDCAIPAGVDLDLRLRARGFVSHYLWGFDAPPGGELTLGNLALRRGGSLVGWLAVDGGRLTAETTVALEPLGGDGSASAGAGGGEHSSPPGAVGRFQTAPNENGFFAFDGLSPGAYRLTATQPGMAATELFPLQIYKDSETRIDQPVLLAPPREVEVYVDPPLDAFGEPWRVDLGRDAQAGRIEPVRAENPYTEAGGWRITGLPAGRYRVAVIDSQGSRFGEQRFELPGLAGPLFLELDLVPVEGRLLLGDEPLWAAATFRWPGGSERVEMISNEEGELFGFLPREGEWDVLIESDDPDVSRRFSRTPIHRLSAGTPARVHFELPDTAVVGVVVDEDGGEVPGAIVAVAPARLSQAPVSRRSDAEGRFELRGLDPDAYSLHAELDLGTETLRSQSEIVALGENVRSPELRLVLRPERRIQGRVLTAEGFAVPAATVQVTALSGSTTLPLGGTVLTTGGDGRFAAGIPAQADGVALDVLAPGFALSQQIRSGALDEPFELTVEPYAGTLVLELPATPIHWNDWSQPIPVVFRAAGGLGLGANNLIRWAQINGVPPPPPSPRELAIPLMPPGRYSVCMVSPRYLTLDTRATIPAERCAAGELQAFGELRLLVPAE